MAFIDVSAGTARAPVDLASLTFTPGLSDDKAIQASEVTAQVGINFQVNSDLKKAPTAQAPQAGFEPERPPCGVSLSLERRCSVARAACR